MRIWAGTRIGHRMHLGGMVGRGWLQFIAVVFCWLVALGLVRESGVLQAVGRLL